MRFDNSNMIRVLFTTIFLFTTYVVLAQESIREQGARLHNKTASELGVISRSPDDVFVVLLDSKPRGTNTVVRISEPRNTVHESSVFTSENVDSKQTIHETYEDYHDQFYYGKQAVLMLLPKTEFDYFGLIAKALETILVVDLIYDNGTTGSLSLNPLTNEYIYIDK